MALYSGNESLLCKVFASSFREIASDWFHKLPKRSVKTWEGLAKMFVARFVINKLQPLRVDSLMALRIDEDESLRTYARDFRSRQSSFRSFLKDTTATSWLHPGIRLNTS